MAQARSRASVAAVTFGLGSILSLVSLAQAKQSTATIHYNILLLVVIVCTSASACFYASAVSVGREIPTVVEVNAGWNLYSTVVIADLISRV